MKPDERGSALLIAMSIMLAMAVIGVTFLSVSLTGRKIASNEADSAKAFAVAEAGIEDARAALPGTNVNALLTAGGHLFTASTVGAGTYAVDVTNNWTGAAHVPTFPTGLVPADAGGQFNDTDRLLLLNATGTVRKASRRVETIVRLPQNFFNVGVWCDNGGTFSGSSYLDAYNSTTGAYGGANIANDATAFCNGNLDLSGSAQIRGNCTVGDTSCTGGGGVTGTRTTNAGTQTLSPPACPVGYPASMPAPATYNAATGALTVSAANMDLPVPPTVYNFSSVTVSGGSGSITLVNPSHLHVDIYVSGALTVSGGGFVNSSTPDKLSVWACGAATNNWTVSGGSNAAFALFAPNRQVTLSGGSPFFGSIVAGTLVNSGGSAIHYDHALASSGVASIVGRTWREIFP
jgi:hypothetical protein